MGGSSAYIDHADAIGSTTMETDPAGGVQWDTTYYPWGQVWQQGGTRQSAAFAGLDWRVNDPLIPSATRELSPALGRWMTPDPLGGDITNPQSLNRYAYVMNNPTTLTDPLGLQSRSIFNTLCSNPMGWELRQYCSQLPFGPGSEFDLMNIPAGEKEWGVVRWIQGTEPGFDPEIPVYGFTDVTFGTALELFPGELGGGYGRPTSPGPQKPSPQRPQKKPCTPLANNLQGTPAAGLDTLIDAMGRLTHPLEILAVNATMFYAAGGQMAAGGMAIAGGCLDPTPFEPLTCGVGGAVGIVSIASGMASGAFGVYFFKNYTLPAIKDWGCHE